MSMHQNPPEPRAAMPEALTGLPPFAQSVSRGSPAGPASEKAEPGL
ncbi:MAG: hypothetical protein MI923_12890 [Phycisphaerales bacterium]|nr:hypothetical protein [Phycisphaerales bacterium]